VLQDEAYDADDPLASMSASSVGASLWAQAPHMQGQRQPHTAAAHAALPHISPDAAAAPAPAPEDESPRSRAAPAPAPAAKKSLALFGGDSDDDDAPTNSKLGSLFGGRGGGDGGGDDGDDGDGLFKAKPKAPGPASAGARTLKLFGDDE